MDDGDLRDLDTRPFPFVDPDLADHPRFQTADELRAAAPAHQQEDVRCFEVNIMHTITDKTTNPYFVLLHDKVEGRECYMCHTCTCGYGVRCGVPCRHFWAVLRSSSEATFHQGLVNDLAPRGLPFSQRRLSITHPYPRQRTWQLTQNRKSRGGAECAGSIHSTTPGLILNARLAQRDIEAACIQHM
uniref:SWIM-type domain-containing protein n=1 Tax=Tetraselmis chuii TaxID=63592 RepID=A0A7S1SSS1_9CHLO